MTIEDEIRELKEIKSFHEVCTPPEVTKCQSRMRYQIYPIRAAESAATNMYYWVSTTSSTTI